VRRALRSCRDAGILPHLLEEEERQLALAAGLTAPLSESELRVLRMLGAGLTQQEIARQLYLSRNVVRSYTRTILAKFGVTSQPAALALARGGGLLS
jgi:LuxR family maltose regulon positive regulatory protein